MMGKMKGGMDPYAGRERSATGAIGGPKAALVEFAPPEGLELDGEKGSAMVNWTMTPEGKIRITAIEGVTMDGAGDVEVEEMEDYS